MSTTAFIIWKDSYSVGNSELDSHHKSIVSIINDLYSSIQDHSTTRTTGEMLNRLYKYTQVHFDREEELMLKHSYPDLANHKTIHEHMVQKTYDLQKRDLRHKQDTASETFTFLKDWWLNHIQAVDKLYLPYLK